MAEERVELRKINWREVFPWTEIFRSFRLALDLKKLLLAAVAIALVFGGCWVFAKMFSIEAANLSAFSRSPWAEGPVVSDSAPITPVSYLLAAMFMLIKGEGFGQFCYGLLCLLWTVAVWTLFAGAITRIAAVQLAREEKIGIGEAIKFALKKYLSFIGAPIFPIIGIVFFAVLCMLGGLLGLIPGFGEIFASLFWFLPMIAGFVMVIIAIGLAVGWPLMYATISAEGSDSFDAISRSYSYIYQRPWRYAWYWIVGCLYGAIVIAFVCMFTYGMLWAGKTAVGVTMGQAKIAHLHKYAPPARIGDLSGGDSPVALGFNGSFRTGLSAGMRPEAQAAENVGAVILTGWLGLVFLLMVGFVHSFFWSASTIIYFLLRRDVDATEMDEVYLEEEEEEEEFDLGPEPKPEPEAETPAEEAPAEEAPAEEPKPEEEGGEQAGEEEKKDED